MCFSQIFNTFLPSNIIYFWQALMPILWVPIFSFQPSPSSCTLTHNVLLMKFHDLVAHTLKIFLLGLSVALFNSFLSLLQLFLCFSLLTLFQFPHSPVLLIITCVIHCSLVFLSTLPTKSPSGIKHIVLDIVPLYFHIRLHSAYLLVYLALPVMEQLILQIPSRSLFKIYNFFSILCRTSQPASCG